MHAHNARLRRAAALVSTPKRRFLAAATGGRSRTVLRIPFRFPSPPPPLFSTLRSAPECLGDRPRCVPPGLARLPRVAPGACRGFHCLLADLIAHPRVCGALAVCTSVAMANFFRRLLPLVGGGTSRPDRTIVELADDERYFGLENFGNTCYANSVIQMLYFCHPFRERVLEWAARAQARGRPQKESILSCLAELFAQVSRDRRGR